MVIEKARELGIALSESEEFIRMSESRAAMEADDTLMAQFYAYNAKQEEMAELMSDESADTGAVEALSADIERRHIMLYANPKFREMLEGQAGFMALMKRVNRAIGLCIGVDGDDDEESEGCGGSCGHCSGCTH